MNVIISMGFTKRIKRRTHLVVKKQMQNTIKNKNGIRIEDEIQRKNKRRRKNEKKATESGFPSRMHYTQTKKFQLNYYCGQIQKNMLMQWHGLECLLIVILVES